MIFAAGLLRGFTGYGFAVAAVPLLSLIVRPSTAVPIVLLLQVFVSASGWKTARRECDWRSIGRLVPSAMILTPLGVLALARLPDSAVRLCIAGIVAAAVVVLGRGSGATRLANGPWALLFGGVAGLFNGLAGIPGPPIIAYYLASELGSATARASMIVMFLVTGLAALVPLACVGTLTAGSVILALAAFPIVWVGSWMGARLFLHATEVIYRRTGLVVLSLMALLTATQAVIAMV